MRMVSTSINENELNDHMIMLHNRILVHFCVGWIQFGYFDLRYKQAEKL